MYFRLRIIRLTRRVRSQPALGFSLVGVVVAASIVLNAVMFWAFDRGAHGGQLGFGDALWYSVISITTIGYGDFSAQSFGARLSTVLFIVLVGLTAFSVLLGMAVDAMGEAASRGQKGLHRVLAENHVLVVHFPSEARVRQLIDEIRVDPEHGAEEIVIISDQIDELPFRMENVLFVRGSPHDAATYRRASAETCRLAIVLSRNYNDPNSDAIVAAASSVIDSISPETYIVAECLHEKHRELFRSVRCDAVVAGLKMAGNLLVREVHDPGVSQLLESLTSNKERGTLYSADVPAGGEGLAYAELSHRLVERDANLLAVKRGDTIISLYAGETAQPGDTVIFVAERRMRWDELANA